MGANLIRSKVSMYKDASESDVRITVGTEQIGLTYYLSCAKLEKLDNELNESGHLKNNTSTLAITDESPAGHYRLECSYFAWLERSSFTPVFAQSDRTGYRPPLPFVDRIHDLTFRLEPDIVKPLVSPLSFRTRVGDYVSQEKLAEGLAQCLAMSAAAIVYGGLHMLTWNAPFHNSIHGLLWRISAITIASLGVIRLLGTLASLQKKLPHAQSKLVAAIPPIGHNIAAFCWNARLYTALRFRQSLPSGRKFSQPCIFAGFGF
jgi:hypothetical protein